MSRLILAVLVSALVGGCGATRPPGPPVGAERTLPWGAVLADPSEAIDETNLEGRLEKGLDQIVERLAEDGGDRRLAYRVLALSGGGSRGAFGAGFLLGWSASGNRPSFEVVTGISTGALMATFAFLGPDYDDGLRLYQRVSSADLYRVGSPLQILSGPSMHDTTPMRELIAREIDDEVIDAVGAEHRAGRRLFIGTTNLESGRFTIWDLGAIASSDRPERYERYRDVVLAAAAFPVMFPPVYIPVEIDGERYWEAHVDGAARAAVFARSFMLDLEDLLERVKRRGMSLSSDLYVIANARPSRPVYTEVRARASSVAERSVDTMLTGIGVFSATALFQMAMHSGTGYRITWIPTYVQLDASPLEFDPDEMSRLFDIGYRMGSSERPFIWTTEPPESPEALLEIVDPDAVFDLDVLTLERAAGLH